MLRRPTTQSNAGAWIAFAVLCAAFSAGIAVPAFARDASPQESANVPCAVLQDFAGGVEVLDSSRMSLITVQKGAGIPCGGWISITNGWAKLKHRDGHWFRVGPNTFAEVLESNKDGQKMGDHLVLFRGMVWADAETGSGELRIITANGRARLTDAAAIVIFSQGTEDTQLITLENKATLENRFETSRVAKVQAGEASQLNFGLLRVVPSLPRTVAIASLRSLFADLHVDDETQGRAIAAARSRQDRKFASELAVEDDEPVRKPAADSASEKLPKNTWTAVTDTGPGPQAHSYLRHPVSAKEKARVRKQWVDRMTAGEPVGERILFPDKFYGRPQQVKVHVTDPGAEQAKARGKSGASSDDAEKRRLIDELSQIREN